MDEQHEAAMKIAQSITDYIRLMLEQTREAKERAQPKTLSMIEFHRQVMEITNYASSDKARSDIVHYLGTLGGIAAIKPERYDEVLNHMRGMQ